MRELTFQDTYFISGAVNLSGIMLDTLQEDLKEVGEQIGNVLDSIMKGFYSKTTYFSDGLSLLGYGLGLFARADTSGKELIILGMNFIRDSLY